MALRYVCLLAAAASIGAFRSNPQPRAPTPLTSRSMLALHAVPPLPRAARSSPVVAVAPVTTDDDEERRALDANLYNLNRVIVDTVKGAIDVVYKNNAYARFYVLEYARYPSQHDQHSANDAHATTNTRTGAPLHPLPLIFFKSTH